MMRARSLVAVVIPVYNHEKFVECAVHSVRTQIKQVVEACNEWGKR